MTEVVVVLTIVAVIALLVVGRERAIAGLLWTLRRMIGRG